MLAGSINHMYLVHMLCVLEGLTKQLRLIVKSYI